MHHFGIREERKSSLKGAAEQRHESAVSLDNFSEAGRRRRRENVIRRNSLGLGDF